MFAWDQPLPSERSHSNSNLLKQPWLGEHPKQALSQNKTYFLRLALAH
jgi:hypothetical protein